MFLEATLADLCRRAGRRLRTVVRVCDRLEQTSGGEAYDLVVGVPRRPDAILDHADLGQFRNRIFRAGILEVGSGKPRLPPSPALVDAAEMPLCQHGNESNPPGRRPCPLARWCQ